MTNKELQLFLSNYPGDMPIKLDIGCQRMGALIVDMTEENILHTSETAYVNQDAEFDEWDAEDGKIELGDGKQYLLFNPLVI